MSTLDDRLNDPGYKNWIKAIICLGFLKTGTEPFADQRSKLFHQHVMNVLGGNPSVKQLCNGSNIYFDKRKRKWVISCCNKCQQYIDVIETQKSPGFTFRQTNWNNSDMQLWPNEPWEMAKTYMNSGQKRVHKTPKDTDISGILNFLDHCLMARNGISNSQYISQVRDARNTVMHSAEMKLSPAELQDITNAMLDLLEDQLVMCNIQEAQEAASSIKEVMSSNFRISKEDEIQALKKTIEEIQKLTEGLCDGVLSLENNFTELQQTTKVDVNFLRNKVETDVQEREKEKQKLFTRFNTLIHLVNEDKELTILLKTRVETIQGIFKEGCQRLEKVEKETNRLGIKVENLETTLTAISEKVDDINAVFGPQYSSMISQQDEDNLAEYLKEGYKRTRLRVTVLPGCYSIPVSDISTPAIIVKDKGSFTNASQVFNENQGRANKTTLKSYKNLFYKEDKPQKNTIILGKAGSGKTIFCKHLVDAWCNPATSAKFEEVDIVSNFKFVFHIQCRLAADSDSMVDMICNQLACDDRMKAVVKHVLKTKPEECLVLMDGVDEWCGSMDGTPRFLYDLPGLPSRKGAENAVVLTTTRPWKIAALSDRLEHDYSVSLLEIQGIKGTRELALTILRKLQHPNPDLSYTNFLVDIAKFKLRKFLQTPLMFVHILALWHSKASFNPSICSNYSRMLEFYFQRAKGESGWSEDQLTAHLVKTLPDLECKWAKSAELLPSCFIDTYYCQQYAGLIIRLGRLAFELLSRAKHEQSLAFSIHDTRIYLSEAEMQVCLAVGILSKTQAFGGAFEMLNVYSFSHKTFQEFLAAIWMSINHSEEHAKLYECCKTLDDIFDLGDFIQFLCGVSTKAGEKVWEFVTEEVADKDEEVRAHRFEYDDEALGIITRLQELQCKCMDENILCNQKEYQHTGNQQSFCLPDIVIRKSNNVERQTSLCDTLSKHVDKVKSLVIDGVRMTHERIKQIFSSLKDSPQLQKLRVCDVWCSDHYGNCCFPTLDLQKSNVLKVLKLKCVTSASVLLPTTYRGAISNRCGETTTLETRTTTRELQLQLNDAEQLSNKNTAFGLRLRLEKITLSHQGVINLLKALPVATSRLQVFGGPTVIEQSYEDSDNACLVNIICRAHGKRCTNQILNLLEHRVLKELILTELVIDIALPTNFQESFLSTIILDQTQMTHNNMEQIVGALPLSLRNLTILKSRTDARPDNYSGGYLNISCRDHGNGCSLPRLDLQGHQKLETLEIRELSLQGMLLPLKSKTSLTNLLLVNISLTHSDLENMLVSLPISIRSLILKSKRCAFCEDHGIDCCLTRLDLRKCVKLEALEIYGFVFQTVVLPNPQNTCLTKLVFQNTSVTSSCIKQLFDTLPVSLTDITISYERANNSSENWNCGYHDRGHCVPVLLLSNQRTLEKLDLTGLSLHSLSLPSAKDCYLVSLALNGVELRCLHDNTLKTCMNLQVLKIINPLRKESPIVLDLRQSKTLKQLMVINVVLGNLLLPVTVSQDTKQYISYSIMIKDVTLSNQCLQELFGTLASCSFEHPLKLNNLICTDHADSKCAPCRTFHSFQRLEKLEVLCLPESLQYAPGIRIKNITQTTQCLENLCELAFKSEYFTFELTNVSCSDAGCLPTMDLQNCRFRSLELRNISLQSLMLPNSLEIEYFQQDELCLLYRYITIENVTMTRPCLLQFYSRLDIARNAIQLTNLSCTDDKSNSCQPDLYLSGGPSTLKLQQVSLDGVRLHECECSTLEIKDVTLTYRGLYELCTSLASCCELNILTLDNLSLSDGKINGRKPVLDIKKNKRLQALTLINVSFDTIMIPSASSRHELPYTKVVLQNVILTKQGIEELRETLSSLSIVCLEVENLSCCDDAETLQRKKKKNYLLQ